MSKAWRKEWSCIERYRKLLELAVLLEIIFFSYVLLVFDGIENQVVHSLPVYEINALVNFV